MHKPKSLSSSKNIKRNPRITNNRRRMTATTISASNKLLAKLLLVALSLVSFASAFQQDYSKKKLPRSVAAPSRVVLQAIPGRKKLKGLRKRIFSRTRRGYKNDDGGVEEGLTDQRLVALEDATTTTSTPIISTIRMPLPTEGELESALSEEQPTKKKGSMARYLTSALGARTKKKQEPLVVQTVDELRHAVLDRQLSLSDTTIVEQKEQLSPLMDHAVRDLLKERFVNKTTPGHRLPGDTATLALAIEGGGMRGCVSAGMAAAITALGLSDCIDSIYGSSAGSVVGAYMVSRQVCVDVYVDILPASKKLFVCKKRMVTNLASLGLGQMLLRNNKEEPSLLEDDSRSSLRKRLLESPPGMNISFVLDGIMGGEHGLRPLDVEAFRHNNQKQKLRVVSSCVDPQTGKLFSKCFGHEEFFHEESGLVRADQVREGLFACLQASMTVPGATGPPVNLVPKNDVSAVPLPCFDAFCFEPIPYRSAVEEGATHVLALASRPEDYVPKTKPGIYETGVAPLYFNSHGQKGVSEYFEKGGQQYVYAEDLMLLEAAKFTGHDGILVPPPEIMYGVPRTNALDRNIRDRESTWKKAHVFPVRVPQGFKELQPLEQDKDEVLEAVRDGFMAAFDSLKDIVGLESLQGKDVAELIFPSSEETVEGSSQAATSETGLTPSEERILRTKLHVPGNLIPKGAASVPVVDEPVEVRAGILRRQFRTRRIFRRRGGLFGHGKHHDRKDEAPPPALQLEQDAAFDLEEFSATSLLQCLPGFRDGNYSHLAKGLIERHEQQSRSSSTSVVA